MSMGDKMKELVINDDNLREEEMDRVITRVKAFIINSDKKVLIARSNGGCQLPGGHVEKNESYEDALIREIKEEVGISISKQEIKEFFKIRRFMKNYFNTSQNVISDVVYYVVNTDQKPNKKNTHYTSLEKEYQFHIESIDFKNLAIHVNDVVNKDGKQINRIIADELIYAYEELKKCNIF